MGQPGAFDAARRLAALSKKGGLLEAIAAPVPRERFRADIEAVALAPEAEKKNGANRKPFDGTLIVRMAIRRSPHSHSHEPIEYQGRARLSLARFLGLEFGDDVRDGTMSGLFRARLAQARLVAPLFKRFNRHLITKGYIARGGSIVRSYGKWT